MISGDCMWFLDIFGVAWLVGNIEYNLMTGRLSLLAVGWTDKTRTQFEKSRLQIRFTRRFAAILLASVWKQFYTAENWGRRADLSSLIIAFYRAVCVGGGGGGIIQYLVLSSIVSSMFSYLFFLMPVPSLFSLTWKLRVYVMIHVRPASGQNFNVANFSNTVNMFKC